MAAAFRRSRLGGEPEHDVLIVIAEAAAKDVDAARLARVWLDLYPHPNRMVGGEVEIFRRQRRDSHAVDERAVGRHSPTLQHAVLAALKLPPVGRIEAAVIAEITGAGPHAKLSAVDRDGDVGWPVGGGPWHLGGKFERQLERRDRLADVAGVIGKLVLDEAAREPHESRIHSVGIEEGSGHVEKTNDPFRRAKATRRAHFTTGVEPDRHCDLDGVCVYTADVVAKHHQDLVEGGEAELLVALAALLRFRPNEAGALENLQIGRDSRLRKVERCGDVVDIEAGATMEQA